MRHLGIGLKTRAFPGDRLLERYVGQLGYLHDRRKSEAGLIAARHATEQQKAIVERALLDAQVADRAKSDFLSAMSHELRTPLNAIIGFSEIMQLTELGDMDGDRIMEYAQQIAGSGSHLLKIINSILEFSQAQSADDSLKEDRLDPTSLIGSALLKHRPEAGARSIRIKCDIEIPTPQLTGDEAKMKQVLDALLSNAIKFTPDGGSVAISTDLMKDGCYRFTFADTGIGMAEEDIPKALAPFSQIDSSLSRQYEGTGLGLTLARVLIAQHTGELYIESEVGKGTTVTVILPANRVSENSASGNKASATAQRRI